MTHNPDTHLAPLAPADLGDRQQRIKDSGTRSQCGPRYLHPLPISGPHNNRRQIPEIRGGLIQWVAFALAAGLAALAVILTVAARTQY